ncbi:MAG: hypothetical protein IPP91_08230 [Betaproteobacteria bacterium]|nr:hypothetical protein [Betaproteobacteria bacterium]
MRLKTSLLIAALVGMVAGTILLMRGDAGRIGVAPGFGEGCIICHGNVTGLEGPHAPATIGCASCHAGDKRTLDKAIAHAGMVLVPGNLADAARTCGQAGCHEAIVPRVERSIMATMSGVIAVNRAVLGESAREGAPLPDAKNLGHGVADSHLRELCVGCHLGQAKTDWGPVTEESQGGGCIACHLEYGAEAAKALAGYAKIPSQSRVAAPSSHPGLTLNPRNDHCFGCHSRSGRIALGYEGWHERHTPDGKAPTGIKGTDPRGLSPLFRKLADGRFVEKIVPDIHHERGMECIDCHTANEVMGAGAVVARKSQQLRVGCEDCHARKHASVAAESMDPESRKLMALRKWTLSPGSRMGTTRDGDPIVNLAVNESGGARLLRKRTGQPLELKPPLAACTENKGHERLSCASCHAAWAPRCTSCHTTFDPKDEGFDHAAQKWVKGTWNETSGPFEATLPTLGVLAEGRARGAIDTFVPGMIMTFDRNREAGKPPDVLFRRLYAKLFAHTIRREVRSCKSCHSDSVALGFGKGALRYVVTGNTGRWQFVPAQKPSAHDGLPEDAWTGFLQARTGMVSTREGARPFSIEEQKRILTVGACLACHAEDSEMMKQAASDFEPVLARRSARCALPEWSR